MTGSDPTTRTAAPDAQEIVDALANPAGQPRLNRRVAPHATSLRRMRDRLAAPAQSLALRSLARAGTDDPAVALLDAWAVVADTVSFYTERIATEGYLRTAVLRGSVRELARTLGQELRPGVAAQVDLAFTVETAGEPPEVVVVPAGTPVQSVPGPGALPQTFETADDLEARPEWNAVPVVDTTAQQVNPHTRTLWVRGTTSLRPGDSLLLTLTGPVVQWEGAGAPVEEQDSAAGDPGDQPAAAEVGVGIWAGPGEWVERTVTSHHLLTVAAVAAATGPTAGWTAVAFDRDVFPSTISLTEKYLPRSVVSAHAFGERVRPFGWNAPDPNLLVVNGGPPIGASLAESGTTYRWDGFALGTTPLDLDGEHPKLLPGSRVVLEQGSATVPGTVRSVSRDGRSAFAVAGPVTAADVTDDTTDDTTKESVDLVGFDRRGLVVHAVSSALDALEMPDLTPLTGTTVVLAATRPPLPAGRRVVLVGSDPAGAPRAAARDVVDVQPSGTDRLTLTLSAAPPELARQGLVLLGNVADATHGETVTQVLGSGDARNPFQSFLLRRPPLTYVRATTPAGARAALVVRVDGVEWTPVDSLLGAGPADRVYVVRREEGGGARVVFGDGVHGARPASGTENVTAVYRTGIGPEGAVAARSVTLLVRRPLGIREVTNPLPSSGWAAAETLAEARLGAPMLVRTLDRAVSVADYQDFARGYAAVGPARADLVWDGTANRLIVSVLGSGGLDPGESLVAGLRRALDAARDPSVLLDVRAGERLWFGLRVEVAHDPARIREEVVAAVHRALTATWGPAARDLAAPVTAAAVLVAVRSVPGVAACTVPRLFPVERPAPTGTTLALPADAAGTGLLPALPGRWDGQVRPAQLLALASGATDIGEMTR